MKDSQLQGSHVALNNAFMTASSNAQKIILGLSLVYENAELFNVLREVINNPFDTTFDEAMTKLRFDEVHEMLQLALLSSVAGVNKQALSTTIKFGRVYKAQLSISEEVCKYLIKADQAFTV